MTAGERALISPTPCRLILPERPVPYGVANDAIHELAARRGADEAPDVLVLLEHPPVFTAGRTTREEHLVWTEEVMRARGAELHRVDRGGSLTFHGPGQLVGYPILRLDSRLDVIPHVRKMEEVVIRAARGVGVNLGRSDRQTGVWAGDRKVCAIGVRLTRERVTIHGFGLNCSTDLSWFEAIVPCGLADRTVTSLSELADRPVTVVEMVPIIRNQFEKVFDKALDLENGPTTPATLGRMFDASAQAGPVAAGAAG